MDAARTILLQYEDGLITSFEAIFKLHHLVETNELSATVGWSFALQIAVLMRESTDGLGVDFNAKN